MRGDIVARFPQDAEKLLHTSNGTEPFAARECNTCEDCGAPAALVIQGETDSIGWEPMAFCAACWEKSQSGIDEYAEALDVPDRAPTAGHVFLVNEMTNHDGHGSWCRSFRSFRKATAFYRSIDEKAEQWSGLYPDAGVQEVPVEKARAALDSEARAREEEWEMLERPLVFSHDGGRYH